MKTTRFFAEADRYVFDFKYCSYERGFAQLDTAQDASYFGTWASPTERRVVNYCEGDVTIQEAETDEEFATALREIDAWNVTQGHGNARIDPGLDPAMRAAFEAIGLADMMH